MTDPIADMLTRIRNSMSINEKFVNVPHSNIKESIASVLKEEGYIVDFKINEENNKKEMVIELKYLEDGSKVIHGLKRISKPGLRIYANKEELPKVLNGLGTAIISTSQGIITDEKARELGVGGEVIAYIW